MGAKIINVSNHHLETMFTNFQSSDTHGKRLFSPTNLAQKLSTRWFKVSFLSPSWRSPFNHLKGHVFTTPKKLTSSQNCQEKKSTQRYIGKLPTACVSGSKRVKAFFAICAARAHRARPDWTQLMVVVVDRRPRANKSRLVCVATEPNGVFGWRILDTHQRSVGPKKTRYTWSDKGPLYYNE